MDYFTILDSCIFCVYQRLPADIHFFLWQRIAETLDFEIKRWAAGKEGNLRALLSTLQYVCWCILYFVYAALLLNKMCLSHPSPFSFWGGGGGTIHVIHFLLSVFLCFMMYSCDNVSSFPFVLFTYIWILDLSDYNYCFDFWPGLCSGIFLSNIKCVTDGRCYMVFCRSHFL